MFPFKQKMILRKAGAALLIVAFIGWCLLLQPLWTTGTGVPQSRLPQNHAYVFYATENPYACSALVNAHRLRTRLASKIPIIFLVGPGVDDTAIAAFKTSNIGITVVLDDAPPLPADSMEYYSEVLLKLRAFRLHQVNPALERIVVMDSDQLVRKNLDHLFSLPAADVAAPLLYWGGGMGVTTALMVASLSDELWGIVDGAMHHMRNGEYDMDLINKVLQKRLMVLPGRYCTLNSHWEARDTPGWFKGTKTKADATSEELEALYKEVEVLHFTAMGKPWGVMPSRIVSDRVILRQSEVHPLFVEQFEEWHKDANQLCTAFWEFEEPPPVEPPETPEPSTSKPPPKTPSKALPKATSSVKLVHTSAPIHTSVPAHTPARAKPQTPAHTLGPAV